MQESLLKEPSSGNIRLYCAQLLGKRKCSIIALFVCTEQRINAMQRVIVIFQKSCHPSSSAVKAIQSAGMKNEQAI